jgi:uncharacterized protein HemX
MIKKVRLLLAGLLFWAMVLGTGGCDEAPAANPETAREHAQQRELQRLEQQRRVLEAKAAEAENDARTATMIWMVAGLGLVVVTLLLIREHQLRRRLMMNGEKGGRRDELPG